MPSDDALLVDMLLAARDARSFAAGVTYDEFTEDRELQYALRKAIEIIGEAAGRLSDAAKLSLPGIPWRDVTGMRHRLIHDYRRIDLRLVWEVVQNDFPQLIAALEPIVPPEEP
jgi:uncharacterized protein with HEPN domain